MFHHSHNWSTSAAASIFHRRSHDGVQGHLSSSVHANEYEFSCSNSPASFHLPNFNLSKKKHGHGGGGGHSLLFPCAHPPATEDDVIVVNAAIMKALEMISNSEAASPALPGFGRTPMVRQLRVTDSPFPLRDIEEDNRVDEAAEEFITRFYNDLRRQN